LSFISNVLGRRPDRETLAPLYRATVALARNPFWYRDGRVPDTIDGRFDMLAFLLALVLLRLEAAGEDARVSGVLLTECFIEDMEGSIREFGTGDLLVGKRVGQLVGALGGRLGALRDAIDGKQGFEAAVKRNIFHEAPPDEASAALVAGRLEQFHDRLQKLPTDDLLTGQLPPP
jgi:cytochrome b pre-mRNA-processing protein 3